MSDLSDFLLARMAEDEAVARAATPGPWYWEQPSSDSWPQMDESLMSSAKKDGGYDVPVLSAWGHDAYGIDGEDADREHIARHNPNRVIAECEAKRRIVEALGDYKDGHIWASGESARAEEALEALALPYADHPDYRSEWRP